jgi:hypothetical protein
MNVQAGGVRVMISARALRAPLNWTVAGLSVLDLAVAVILSGYAVALVSGVFHPSHPHGGAAASVAVLAMILPMAWRRPAPLAAAAVMGAAALLNGLVFGPIVRCGAFLPAIFLVAYAVGVRRDRAASAAGLLLCAAAVVAEGLYDPQIEGGAWSLCSRSWPPSSPPDGWSAPGRRRPPPSGDRPPSCGGSGRKRLAWPSWPTRPG